MGTAVDVRLHPDEGTLAPSAAEYGSTIQIQYLGSEGFLIQRGDRAILTAPHYTNPHWLRVGLGWIKPDTALIKWLHPRPAGVSVEAILIGHAHYDHLLDVPFLAGRYHPDATLYGSPSVARLTRLADSTLMDDFVILTDAVARDGRPGKWFYHADSTIRIMALESAHGPHAMGLHVMSGPVNPRLKHVPRSAWRWREGETLAYLVDFLSNQGTVDFRIYYQDATTPDSTGLLPNLSERDEHGIDLAIFCVGSSQLLPEYPGVFLSLYQPRHVMLAHWENFFRSPVKPANRLRFTQVNKFVQKVQSAAPQSSWTLPEPGAWYHYTAAGK